MFYLVYQFGAPPDDCSEAKTPGALSVLPPGYSLTIWRPGWRAILPPTLGAKFVLWWLFHRLCIFRNRNYAVLIVLHNERPVHRTCLIPKYFRWPFMRADDLQVSSTWTDPGHRNLGLARFALEHAVRHWSEKGRAFWYVTHADNAASVAVCSNAGFSLKNMGRRTRRWGLRLLGKLVLLQEGGAGGMQSAAHRPRDYKVSAIPADSRFK